MKAVCTGFRRQRIFIMMMLVMPIIAGTFMGCPNGGGNSAVPGTTPGQVGMIMVPENPAPYPLQVDGSPMSMNANLAEGNWEWYKFGGEAGRKYYIYATGNAPVNVMLFQGVQDEDESEMAIMLWTTNPVEPEFFYWEHGDDFMEKSSASKAIAIPSFVAPETGNYYIVVQAAKVLECLPNCKDDDILLASYYDVRTYSVQVSTYAETADANALTVYDPADAAEAPFAKGEVKMNNHDWFYFDATADTNYMIEFMEPARNRGSVSALVYSPLGDITCEVVDCDACDPQPLYSPQAGRYYILVTLEEAVEESGHIELTPDAEYFGCEYLLRIFVDDGGNAPAVALPHATPALAGDPVVMDGYLTRGDEDWYKFVAAPYSSYWVETRGLFDLRLNVSGNTEAEPLDEDDPGVAAFLMREYDGHNDMAIFQTGREEEEIPFSVRIMYKPLNPFRIDMGPYSVAILADDHVNAHLANVFAATEIAIDAEAAGILWQADSDMFKFTAAKAHFFYRATMEGANHLDVRTINDADTGFVFGDENNLDPDARATRPLSVYYDNESDNNTVRVVVDGVDEDVLETPYTLVIAEDDHRNQTNNHEQDNAVAAAVAPGADVTGVLWPNDTDVFKVAVAAGDVGKMIEADLTFEGAANTVNLRWVTPDGTVSDENTTFWNRVDEAGTYAVVVVHNGTRENATIDYSLAVRFDDHFGNTDDLAETIGTETPPATQIVLPGSSTESELWPEDVDVFWVDVPADQAGRQMEVVVSTEETDNVFTVESWSELAGTDYRDDTFYMPVVEGRYGIVVRRTNIRPTDIVNYTVAVRLNDTANATGDFEADRGVATLMTLNDTENHALWPGASDMYKIVVDEADKGKALTVTVDGGEEPGPVRLYWWPETGTQNSRAFPEFTVTLAETGPDQDVYIIIVDGANIDEILDYSISTALETTE